MRARELGAGAAAATDVERLGGITQRDSSKIQQIIARIEEKFGIKLEIQARASNVHSAKFLNSAEGAVPKPEVFKAKNISDIDVLLGADEAALGQLGVFEPKLPSKKLKTLDSLSPELRKEVLDRFDTQSTMFGRSGTIPTSTFAKKFAKASKPGGARPSSSTSPSAAGDATPNAPREYRIQVDSKNVEAATTPR